MTETLGRGPCGSLKARVDSEIRELNKGNPTLRRTRYSLARRLLRSAIINRSVGQLVGLYLIVLIAVLLAEWAVNKHGGTWVPEYTGREPRDFVKDVNGYFLAGQIGILAIVSVAVGVVTLLSDRGDGSSINTNIRLYYVESYSYELAVSGVALLLILTIQLFWPLQHILHINGLGGRDYSFKIGLSAFHALWFCLNLGLFLQFITTTLRFVEPSSREDLRERYNANEIIPRDAKVRLMRAYYFNLPKLVFGEEELKEGPGIMFGYRSMLDERAVSEIARNFSSPVVLRDIRIRPLQWALNRWRKRVRKDGARSNRFGQPCWDDQITIPLGFDGVFEGETDIVIRRGLISLDRLERWVIRRCFKFGPPSPRSNNLPTPNNFLEQLVDKLVQQVGQNTPSGFRSALDETIRFHRFILAAQNTRDTQGNPLNLAEVGGWMSRPDADLVHQYRRAFSSAADKISSDTFYIDRMSNLAARLIPDDAVNFSQAVLRTLLQIGLHQSWAMEDWLTRHAIVGAPDQSEASNILAGSDKRAYEDAVIGFVGGWEALEQALISAFSLERRPAQDDQDKQWHAFTRSFPVLQEHLHNAAYFFAAAVWNNDEQGSDRLRDMLLRWLNPFYGILQATFAFSNTLLITPDLASQSWTTARDDIARRMRYRQEAALPGPVFGLMLWELHNDVVSISGLIALHWYATGSQPSELASQAALLTLRRVKRPGEGSDLTNLQQKSIFRLLFEFATRYALNPRFAENRYSATIDGLVRSLTNLSSRRMVSGRIYGGYGIDGIETLRPVLLAAMAANLPVQGDDGVGALIGALKADPLFADDKRLRDFTWVYQQTAQALTNVETDPIFTRAFNLFEPQIDLHTAVLRLRIVFSNANDAFEALHKERLLAAPLDEDRMNLIRHRMSDAALAYGPGIGCFRDYEIVRDTSNSITHSEGEFGVIDRGVLTLPQLSALTFSEMPDIFVDQLRTFLASSVWHKLYSRPKRVIKISIAEETDTFWQRAISEAQSVGPSPILLVPYANLGDQVAVGAMIGNGPAGLNVTHDQGMPSGGGTGYLGSVEGIPVYSSAAVGERAVLCSSRIIRRILYGTVHGTRDVADVELLHSDDPERSFVRLKFAQEVQWSEDILVQFDLTDEDTQLEEGDV